jgi:hypothetical protein
MTNNDDTANSPKMPDPGVFVTKGMQVSIPNFSIRFNPDGSIDASPLIIHTSVDMCPYWLEIAYEHLLKTEAANDDLMAAKKEESAEKIAESLKIESTCGMQTIMSSAVAMEAYYANVKDTLRLTATGRRNKQRYLQITEVLERAFHLPGESASQLSGILKKIFTFRNKTVHPHAGTTAPSLHCELNKVTDWRFATFRFHNAKAIAGQSRSIIVQTARRAQANKYEGLETYCDGLLTQLGPILTQWETRYGPLFS